MAYWLWVAFCVVCIGLQPVTPSESHLRKRSDDVSMDALVTAVSQLTEQVTTMRAQMTAQQNSLSSQEAKITSLEGTLNKLKQTVAFHAYSPAHVAATAGGAIVLPTAQTNVGGGYDVRTSFFTAPVSGLYLLHANFMCADLNKYVHAGIYLDGAYIAGTISDCRHGFYDSVSAEALVHVNAGQKVHLGNSDEFPSNYYSYPYTTFSGFLLRAD